MLRVPGNWEDSRRIVDEGSRDVRLGRRNHSRSPERDLLRLLQRGQTREPFFRIKREDPHVFEVLEECWFEVGREDGVVVRVEVERVEGGTDAREETVGG